MGKTKIFLALLVASLALISFAACSDTVYPSITFDSNGGTECAEMTLGEEGLTLPVPTRAKYEFKGWYFDDEVFDRPLTDAMLSDGTITENVTVYAKWEVIEIIITFDSNGGTECAEMTLGEEGQTLPLPTREKYEFKGWYFDDEVFDRPLTNAMLSDGSITENVTVYAKWEVIEIIITFDSNGGTECAEMTLGEEGQTLPLPTREKYEFKGWYFDDEVFDRPLTDAMLSDGSITENVTVYAKWEVIEIVITFDSNSGTECAEMTLGEEGQTLPVPTREKYEFKGWYFDDEVFDRPLTNAMLSDGTITENVTVYAKWESTVVYVTTYVDGVKTDTIEVIKGEAISELENPNKNGYVFDGWYADSGMESKFNVDTQISADCAIYGSLLQTTSSDLFIWEEAEQYFGYSCYGITGVADGAVLPETLVIPEVYDCKPVVCIFWDAFAKQDSIKTVYIPDSITTVCSNAFKSCTSLGKVRMSENISEVGNGAFYDTALYNSAPNGYFYVGAVLAHYKGALTPGFEVNIKEGTRVVADRVFWLDTNVVQVNLPASLIYVGFNAFLRAPVKEYTVPEESKSYKVVDGVLFSKDLTELVYYPVGSERKQYTVPDTVTRIGDEAFQHVYNLVSVTIADSVNTIGDGVFDESETLEEVIFGSGIVSVGDGVLHSPKSLKRIIIKSPTPFPYGVYFLDGSGVPKFDIYIQDEYLEAYRTAKNWSSAAARMKPLSELTFAPE